MSFLDAVRSILGSKPVKVGELAAKVGPPATTAAVRRRPRVKPRAAGTDRIEVIPEYEQVRELIQADVPLLLVTGGAGTGKSTLIRYLRQQTSRRMAVVAPTGVAALNAGGVTIHSLFRLPPKIIQKSDVKPAYDRQLYQKMELLIIDEVSMVRPDLLDGVDRSLRMNREIDLPFGGVQVVLIGDLFQLPPVAPREEQLALRAMGYETDYFFSARGVSECSLVPVLLHRVFRQSDPRFIALLNCVREGKDAAPAVESINAACVADDDVMQRDLVLTCTNRAADERNRTELARLSAPTRTFAGSIEGKFRLEKDRLPSPMNLALARGAQVMFTKNDDGKRWVNGTLGRVVKLGEDNVRVAIDTPLGGETVEVETVTWEQYQYEFDPAENDIVAEVVGRYKQLPLMLAWAVTIHKAQGKTLEKATVDLGNRTFASGQLYVALSRVRRLADLHLSRPIREDDVRCDPLVTSFYCQLSEMTRVTDND